MKKLYTSPVVTVEELTKADVLCASDAQNFDKTLSKKRDNVLQSFKSLGDMSSLF